MDQLAYHVKQEPHRNSQGNQRYNRSENGNERPAPNDAAAHRGDNPILGQGQHTQKDRPNGNPYADAVNGWIYPRGARNLVGQAMLDKVIS